MLALIRTKGLRYVLVSVVNVLVGGGLLVVLQHWIEPVEANICGVAISAVPAYYMNRAWVWGKRGKSHWKKEVLPFWIFTVAGLVLSTIAIHFAQDHTDNRFVDPVRAALRLRRAVGRPLLRPRPAVPRRGLRGRHPRRDLIPSS